MASPISRNLRIAASPGRPTLSDDLIALAFSYHFTWGYPDYIRTAFQVIVSERSQTDKPLNPQVKLSWRQLRELMEEADSGRIRCIVAASINTSPAVLEFLSQVKDVAVVERVAENINAHPSTLARLVMHHVISVRLALCDNLGAPEAVLLALCNDPSPDVRYCLAENVLGLTSVLQLLVDDQNPYVSTRAAQTLSSRQSAEIVTPDFVKAKRQRRNSFLSG